MNSNQNYFWSVTAHGPDHYIPLSYHEDKLSAIAMAKKYIKHLGEKLPLVTDTDCLMDFKNDHYGVMIEKEFFDKIKGGSFPW